MLVTNQKQVTSNQTNIILAHTSSADAKLILLENRMAEHNIESLVLQGNKGRGAKNTYPGGANSPLNTPKLQFSQMMTHAALRRSDLKSRTNNNNDIVPSFASIQPNNANAAFTQN